MKQIYFTCNRFGNYEMNDLRETPEKMTRFFFRFQKKRYKTLKKNTFPAKVPL